MPVMQGFCPELFYDGHHSASLQSLNKALPDAATWDPAVVESAPMPDPAWYVDHELLHGCRTRG